MNMANRWVVAVTISSLMLTFLGGPGVSLGQEAPVNPPQTAQPAPDSANQNPASAEQLPDSPGTVQTQASKPAAPAPATPQTPPGTQKPAGTAAAEIANPSGVTASKPAGVAIAPAKQRRVRSFLIKMGAVMGAAAAVGTVVALSQGSPSRPPGAR